MTLFRIFFRRPLPKVPPSRVSFYSEPPWIVSRDDLNVVECRRRRSQKPLNGFLFERVEELPLNNQVTHDWHCRNRTRFFSMTPRT